VGENPVLQFARASRHIAEQEGMARVLVSPSSQLDAVGRWYGRLTATAHRGKTLTTKLVVKEPRRDPLVVAALPACATNADGLDHLIGKSLTDLQATPRAAHTSPQLPTDTILLPRVDEHSIGQLLQFLVLANLVASFPSKPPA
jgi:glucose-6-phosphate isomerase